MAGPISLVPADMQANALDFLIKLLKDDHLGVAPEFYPMMARAGWASLNYGVEEGDADSLGRLPIHVLQEVRYIKVRDDTELCSIKC